MSSPSTTSTTSTTPAADKQRMPLWALLTGLLITGVVTHAVWRFTTSRDEAEARIGFEARASQIDITVREHLRGYEQALLGMSTIFTTGAPLTGARWATQFDTLRLGDRYPGFQGIGYAPKVALADKARHEAAMRKDESTQYAIRPEGERPIYTPVAYLVPENERHRKAIGFDMYHETLRRAAMDEARDKGQAIITRKIVLSQEKKDSMQPGFLMYVPVYRRDAAITTKIQRQDALQGYVFSTFRMTDLANAILTTHRDIRIEIFDGAGPQANNLLYDSAPHSDPAPGASRTAQLSVLSTVPLYGGAWSLRVSTLPEFETAIDRKGARIATAGAMLICLLALTMLWSQLTLRRRAEDLAAQITRDLAHSREQLELALEGSDLALFDWNIVTGEVHLSARWSLMLGGKAEPVRTTLEALEALVPPEDQPNISQQIHAVLNANTDRYHVEHRVRCHDGSTIWIASRAKVVERDSMNRALRDRKSVV